MRTNKYTRISVSIPVELLDRVKRFNDMNKTRPLNVSAVCCVAIEKELEDIKMEQIGIYFVDATDLEGWTNETLLAALEEPLASIGIGVEIGKHNTGMIFFDNVGYDTVDTIRDQAKFIIEKVVTQ